ncbi:ABC transporter permease [Brucella pseudogrignonensis]|uniref:ABC transporter permease n=1 Tax=Brucella pseudogrignonensis TaxID=419475 RepID=UPI003ECE70A6
MTPFPFHSLKTAALCIWSLIVAIFLLLPILTVLVYSFNTGNYLIIWKETGLRWYWRILEDGNIFATLRTSLIAALFGTALSLIVGGISGVILARKPSIIAYPLSILLLTVISFPEIVKAVAYLIWFVKIDLEVGIVRIAISHALFGSAIVAFIVRAKLVGMDGKIEEAAADLGATPFVTFFTVTLPMLKPAFLVGGLLAFTLSFDDVIVSLFVSTADSTTLPVYILASVRQGLKGDIAAVSAVMFVLTIFAFTLAGFYLARTGTSRRNTVLILAGQNDFHEKSG